MIKYKVGKYNPSDSMSELICDNYPMLLVMSRFGIDLGFGESSIEEVCKKSDVDLYTFLSVVNILISIDKRSVQIDYSKVSLESLVLYLHNSHSYFLEYRFPTIRAELAASLDSGDDVSVVIMSYYDEYVAEVTKHMMYEENTLFPYINSVIHDEQTERYSIASYSEHHDNIDAKLSELKGIIIKYYPSKSTNELGTTLYDIFTCERDLASHSYIEDYLLVPTMRAIEATKSIK